MIALLTYGFLIAAPPQDRGVAHEAVVNGIAHVKEIIGTSPEKAREALEALLESQPKENAPSILQEGTRIFMQAGEWKAGQELFKRLIESHADPAVRYNTYNLLAMGARKAKVEKEWAADLWKKFEAGDRSEPVLFALASATLPESTDRTALDDALVSLYPNVANIQKRRPPDTAALVARADESWQKDATVETLRELSMSFARARKTQAFADWLDRTHRTAPSDMLRDMLLTTLIASGDPDHRFEDLLNDARKDHPDRADLLTTAEAHFRSKGTLEKAANAYEEFLRTHADAFLSERLARLYRDLHKPADALRALEQTPEASRTASTTNLQMILALEDHQDAKYDALAEKTLKTTEGRLVSEVGVASAAGREDRVRTLLARASSEAPPGDGRLRWFVGLANSVRSSGRFTTETFRDLAGILKAQAGDPQIEKAIDQQIELASRPAHTGPMLKSELDKRKKEKNP